MREDVDDVGRTDAPALTLTTTADVGADAIAAALRAHGYAVERHTFVPDRRADPWRVVLLAWDEALAALVALVAPPTAVPGLGAALVEALYPAPHPDTSTTVQLKAAGSFVSVTTRAAPDLLEALAALADRVAAAVREPASADRERHVVYLDRQWYAE